MCEPCTSSKNQHKEEKPVNDDVRVEELSTVVYHICFESHLNNKIDINSELGSTADVVARPASMQLLSLWNFLYDLGIHGVFTGVKSLLGLGFGGSECDCELTGFPL